MNILSILLLVSLSTSCFLFCCTNRQLAGYVSLTTSFFLLALFAVLWLDFDFASGFLQFNLFIGLPFSEIHLAVDGISLYFIFLTFMLLPICILCSWNLSSENGHLVYFFLHFITFLLFLVFTVQDLLFFYVLFEATVIPMFVIMLVWGSRSRKVHAAYQFFLYTLFGSFLMLFSIVYLKIVVGSTHVLTLLNTELDLTISRFIWFSLFLSFAIKVPMLPFHIWLPEAHVEAPTAGSVLLAGILLKMGVYGYIKFVMPIFPEATLYFQPLVYLISLVGITYSAASTIRQVDLKKIVAYSSVGHMNYVMLGVASCTLSGLQGSLLMMLAHGFVSSALFLCVGHLYERFHTRLLPYYGGLVQVMPLFSIFFFFFTLANVSLPGSGNFIGELLILCGTFTSSTTSSVIAAVATVLSAVYSFWCYNRIFFGKLKVTMFSDLNLREVSSLVILFFLTVLSGLSPDIFLQAFEAPLLLVLDRLCL
jgi:proton-translocating NADH-quinone oxidoreductase chain M